MTIPASTKLLGDLEAMRLRIKDAIDSEFDGVCSQLLFAAPPVPVTPEVTTHIGRIIKAARLAIGRGLREFGEFAGADLRAYCDLEQTGIASQRTLGQVEDAFNRHRATEAPDGFLTLVEARERKVCRICKGSDRPRTIGTAVDPFRLEYGKEYAHVSCLKAVGLLPESDNDRGVAQ